MIIIDFRVKMGGINYQGKPPLDQYSAFLDEPLEAKNLVHFGVL